MLRKINEEWKISFFFFFCISHMPWRSRAGQLPEGYHSIKQTYIKEKPGEDSYSGLGGIFP